MKSTAHAGLWNPNPKFLIHVLVPRLKSVTLEEGQISGGVTGLAAKHLPNLLPDFLNWPLSDEDILRFTKRYGPLVRRFPAEPWSFETEGWRLEQASMRSIWELQATRKQFKGFAAGFDEYDDLMLFRDGRVVLERVSLLRFLQDSVYMLPPERMKRCKRPTGEGCDTPYFIAGHLHQEYCSEVCAHWAQKAAKREWWKRRNERIKKAQKGGKKR